MCRPTTPRSRRRFRATSARCWSATTSGSRPGQVLARIDQRDFAVALDQAKADVAAARAAIASKQAQLGVQQAVIDAAKATIDVDQATATFAAQENKRYTDLAATGYGSVQNAQQAQSRIAGAKAAIARDTANLASALKQVDLLKAEIVQANAALARARSRCSARPSSISNTPPSSRRSTASSATGRLRIGQYVQAGTQLMSVVPVAGAYVVANFKETQLTDVREGQAVDIAVDMFPGQVVHGHVDSIAPASGQEFALLPPDNATGNFTKVVQRIPVKIALDPDNGSPVELRPGMSVIPTIETKSQARDRQARRRRRARQARFPEDSAMSTRFSPFRASGFTAGSGRAAADPNRASATVWIAVLAAMIGSFMAILNIQITNASLLNIEGGIGTGVDNGSWISTSYLIGEIVVIPLTDYLSPGVLVPPLHAGQRGAVRGFLGGLRLHPRSAVDDRDARLAGICRRRADPDGVHAGADQTAEAATADRACDLCAVGHLRARDRPDHRRLSHRELRLADHLLRQRGADHRDGEPRSYLTLERQPMQLKLLKEGDWAGIVTMAIGLSALQTVLEEGNKDDWFSSPFILRLALVALVSLSLFVWIELTVEKPLIRLRLLKQRNFGFGTIAMTLLGFALFGSVYILPAYLGQAQGYNAEQIGSGAGLDRPAATAADSAGAETDAALRHPLYRHHRPADLRL